MRFGLPISLLAFATLVFPAAAQPRVDAPRLPETAARAEPVADRRERRQEYRDAVRLDWLMRQQQSRNERLQRMQDAVPESRPANTTSPRSNVVRTQ